tara:strand:- start:415 stop:1491 length:1077 start_codon:yes stop_codon:yes gene_type:complete
MTIIKKILLLFIILITIFILYRLYLQRKALLEEGFREGYDESSIDSKEEYDSLINTMVLPPSIGNFNCPPSMAIKDIVIKGSYNTAYMGGNYVSTDMIKYVMHRGCRFIDFEIYNYTNTNGNKSPVVAVSSQPETIDTLNNIPFTEALNAIDDTAFVVDSGELTVPNPDDPLFIHLRIQNVDDGSFYSDINEILGSVLGYKMYGDNITKNTLFSEIAGKYVVLIDKTSRGYLSENGQNIITNKNGETGGVEFMMYYNATILSQNTRPPILETTSTTNVTNETIVLADKGTDFWGYHINPNMKQLIDFYGVQIVACKYYTYDANLEYCEELFRNFGSGITLLANAVAYVRNDDNTNEDE